MSETTQEIGELIARARGGDEAAFRALADRYGRVVWSVCYRFTRNEEDATDMYQDVWLKVWQGLPGFRNQSAFSTWLYRVAMNAGLNAGRRRPEPTAPLENIPDPVASDPTPEVQETPVLARLREAIAILPDRQRAAVVLTVYERLSQPEAAEVMKVTEGTVKAALHQARRRLKMQLLGVGGSGGE